MMIPDPLGHPRLADHRHAPLAAFIAGLRDRRTSFVPDMDPLDGGPAARVLLLLEKPGPRAARTGFVSPTSAAISAFLDRAGLARRDTLLWNAIPAWNGTIAVTAAELAQGLLEMPGLLDLLPRLDTVLLVGRRAQRAAPILPLGLRVLASAHPSPQVRAAFPDRWAEIPAIWTRAAQRP